jgi:voltage-gated potassium channel
MTGPAKSDELPAAGEGREHFMGRHWDPVSMETAWRFLTTFLRSLYFLRGILLLLLLLAAGGATLMWLVEEDVSLLDSIYFASITALTVGYGDIVPRTLLGKAASAFIGLVGVIIMGILVAASVWALEFTLKSR